MRLSMLLVLLCSAACTSLSPAPEPVVRTVEIKVPVPLPCIDVMPPRPAVTSLADILALGNAGAAIALMGQHNLLLAYAGELEALASGCVLE